MSACFDAIECRKPQCPLRLGFTERTRQPGTDREHRNANAKPLVRMLGSALGAWLRVSTLLGGSA